MSTAKLLLCLALMTYPGWANAEGSAEDRKEVSTDALPTGPDFRLGTLYPGGGVLHFLDELGPLLSPSPQLGFTLRTPYHGPLDAWGFVQYAPIDAAAFEDPIHHGFAGAGLSWRTLPWWLPEPGAGMGLHFIRGSGDARVPGSYLADNESEFGAMLFWHWALPLNSRYSLGAFAQYHLAFSEPRLSRYLGWQIALGWSWGEAETGASKGEVRRPAEGRAFKPSPEDSASPVVVALGADAPKKAASPPPRFDWNLESASQERRARDPSGHFLVDGYNHYEVPGYFFAPPRPRTQFLWPASYYEPAFPRLERDTTGARVAASLTGGNEVGDPLFQELVEEDFPGNRTPYSRIALRTSLPKGLDLWGLFDQNDLHGERSGLRRRSMMQWQSMEASQFSWFGENLPSLSLLGGGISLDRRHSRLEAEGYGGMRWLVSPQSGLAYPFEGVSGGIDFSQGGFGVVVEQSSWRSPWRGSPMSWSWNEARYQMRLQGKGGSMRYRLEFGFENQTLSSDSVFRSMVREGYPLLFQYELGELVPESGWSFSHGGEAAYRFGYTSLWEALHWRYRRGSFSSGPSLRLYLVDPGELYAAGGEKLPAALPARDPLDPLPADFARLHSEARDAKGWGAAPSWTLEYKQGGHETGIELSASSEWDAPVLEDGNARRGVDGLPWRLPSWTAGSLLQAQSRIWYTGHLTRSLSGRVEASWREPLGGTRQKLEYVPAPWWTGLTLKWEAPSGLVTQGSWHWMGEKQVRGWAQNSQEASEVFRIPRHAEAYLQLSQGLLRDKVRLRLCGAHVFGEEILEHPAGSPLRFRILIGMDAWF